MAAHVEQSQDSAPIALDQPPLCGKSIFVPSYGHGVFSVSCSTTIAATPLNCLAAVLDISKYPEWNTFCPSATIESTPENSPAKLGLEPELLDIAQRPDHLYPGIQFQFIVNMREESPSSTTKTKLEVTKLEKFEREGRIGYRVAWKMRGMPPWVLRTERVQEFIETENGGPTEYYCWETFGGGLAHALKLTVASQVADGFGRWMGGLKEFVEKAA